MFAKTLLSSLALSLGFAGIASADGRLDPRPAGPVVRPKLEIKFVDLAVTKATFVGGKAYVTVMNKGQADSKACKLFAESLTKDITYTWPAASFAPLAAGQSRTVVMHLGQIPASKTSLTFWVEIKDVNAANNKLSIWGN